MKVCIIGLCGHSKQAYKYLKSRENIKICGIAKGSDHEENVSRFDPEIPYYDDYVHMLDECAPDLAIISPVFGLTGSIITECAKRKINVFAEKPVASSLEELSLVEKAVKESNIKFCAMHYLRYSPAFYHAAEMVRRGDIGEVKLVTAQKSYKYGKRPYWYSDRDLYVGTIPWVGIHAVDWIYHFTGKRFLSVDAQSIGKDPEMAAVCRFEMDGGVIASANIDYYRPSTAPTHGDDRVRCVGSKGVIEVIDGKINFIGEHSACVTEPTNAPELLEEFIMGREPISAEEIFYLTKVALCARDSADKNVKIRIED